MTLGTVAEGWSRRKAEDELANVLVDVRRGIWRPYEKATVAEPAPEPTFHEFASEWLDGLRSEGLSENTLLDYTWQLSKHLLPFFAGHRLSEITIAEVDRYRQAKVREGEISASSVNKTITRLAQILEVAVERELIGRNPARGKRRRLRERRPERTWLDRAEQITALPEAGGELDAEARVDRRATPRRAFLATLTLAGLRIGEALALHWRDVDLAVRPRVVVRAVERASENLIGRGGNPLPEGITPHSLRRTFISLLLATGAEVPYVMRQVGHSDPKMTLSIYAQVMYRGKGERERLKTIVEGSDWALLGTGGEIPVPEPGEQMTLEAAETRSDAGDSVDGRGWVRTSVLALSSNRKNRSGSEDRGTGNRLLSMLQSQIGAPASRAADRAGNRRGRLRPLAGRFGHDQRSEGRRRAARFSPRPVPRPDRGATDESVQRAANP